MTGAGYFDDLYAAAPDPWGLATEPYEARKHALTVAALPRARYRRAFEPGCAIGVLTARLAERCAELLAWDGAAAAVAATRARVPAAHVRVTRARIPAQWPAGRFDLVLLSELLYYLPAADRAAVAGRLPGTVEPGGHLLAVHWRHPFAEAACTGDEAHAELAAVAGFEQRAGYLEDDFRLDVWERADA